MEIIDLCNQLLIGQLEFLKYFPKFYKQIFAYVSENPVFLSVTAKSYFIIEPFYENDKSFLETASQLIPLFVSYSESTYKEKKIFTFYFGWLMKKLQLDVINLLFEDNSFLYETIDIIIGVGGSFDINIIDTVLEIILFFGDLKEELFDEKDREFPLDEILDFLDNGIDSNDNDLNKDAFLLTKRIINELE